MYLEKEQSVGWADLRVKKLGLHPLHHREDKDRKLKRFDRINSNNTQFFKKVNSISCQNKLLPSCIYDTRKRQGVDRIIIKNSKFLSSSCFTIYRSRLDHCHFAFPSTRWIYFDVFVSSVSNLILNLYNLFIAFYY